MPDIEFLADCPTSLSASAAAIPVTAAPATMTAEDADLSRLVGRGCSIALPWLEPNAALDLCMADAVPAGLPGALALRGAFGAVVAEDGVRFLRALTGIDLTAELDADDARWAWIQSACIGRLAGTPFADVEEIGRSPETELESAAEMPALRLALRSHGHVVMVRTLAAAGTWLNLLRATEWTPHRAPLSELFGLAVEMPVRIARHTLPASALKAVAAGDIIVPDSPNFMCDGTGAIRLGAVHAHVRYEAPCTFTIIALENRVETIEQDVNDYADDFDESLVADMEGSAADESMLTALSGDDEPREQDAALDAPSPEEAEHASALDTVPVTLDFEMGKARMPLGELRTLGPGTIVPFKGGSPASIAILSAGRQLGRGELVDVDGQLAIRITQWGRT
ncbi:YscQ/HrcQ family type III secretion apparatus protein [Noviherbaspirillum cavernae]|uniref:YscQ/HrcQ family type III secretion apparatus protein n=1 Tax=Noviherbaspirillum cavernae TaxID=2320862 RepID=A0A418WW64_9BURK|nr:type III secretion system cytoplasmic ring protein SctQ [Noviherbaspirillum cavernae]RJF96893.1 YscQ/HrcQ family type III secretion apparatus protein [Noviherbaspirillum cavernae]